MGIGVVLFHESLDGPDAGDLDVVLLAYLCRCSVGLYLADIFNWEVFSKYYIGLPY